MINNYLKRRKGFLTFLGVVFIISLIVGIILYFKCSEGDKSSVISSLSSFKDDIINNHINNILKHILYISIIVLLSFTIIGFISSIIYLFYEGMSLSFTICFLIKIYGFKGLIFTIIYNIIFKTVFIILFILIMIKLINIIKGLIMYIILKRKINIKIIIKRELISIIIFVSIIIINDILIYLFGNFILKILVNML